MHFNHFLKTVQERTFVAKLYLTVNCVCTRAYLKSGDNCKCLSVGRQMCSYGILKKTTISCYYYFYNHYCGFCNHMCFSCLITKLKLSVCTYFPRMKLKEIKRTAIQSWSPAQHHPIFLATGMNKQNATVLIFAAAPLCSVIKKRHKNWRFYSAAPSTIGWNCMNFIHSICFIIFLYFYVCWC